MNNNNNFFLGSIDLSKVDKSLIKMVTFKDGTTHPILQITISRRKQPSQYGDTHFISTAPKGTPSEKRNAYIIGDLREWNDQPAFEKPTPEQLAASPAPSPEQEADLPF